MDIQFINVCIARFVLNILVLISVFYVNPIVGQKIFNNPIEFSVFNSTYISFSKLSKTTVFKNAQESKFSSPPQFNDNIGIKLERRILNDSLGLYLNSTFTISALSLTAKYLIMGKSNGQESSISIFPEWNVFSLGFKKIAKVDKNFYFYTELGSRFFVSKNPDRISIFTTREVSDTFIYSEFSFSKLRRKTLVPYMGFGIEYKYRKFKAGFFIWYQNSFQNIYEYNYNVKFGTEFLNSKVQTTGQAFGLNLNVKLFVF